MTKIYLVISTCGECEDRIDTIKKAFRDVKKAEDYIKELEDRERGYRDMANKCRECAGLNKECPFYTMPFYTTDECESYQPWHDNEYFSIEEVDLY